MRPCEVIQDPAGEGSHARCPTSNSLRTVSRQEYSDLAASHPQLVLTKTSLTSSVHELMAITNFAHWSAYWAEHVKTINALIIKWRIPPNDWKKTLKGKGKWLRAQWAEGKTIPDTNRPCVSGELHIYQATPFDAAAHEAPILFRISLSAPPPPPSSHILWVGVDSHAAEYKPELWSSCLHLLSVGIPGSINLCSLCHAGDQSQDLGNA